MSWNYRVVKFADEFRIHEAYYNDESDKVRSITKEGVSPCQDSVEDLKQQLTYMLEACSKPVLDYEDIGAQTSDEEEV
ncbi:hypothetical protein HC928_00155 [bacterium]|nr:hypothetical protein [bacterium]